MQPEDFIYHAAILWAVLNVISMLFLAYLFIRTRKTYFFWYMCACLLKSLWGLTLPGIAISVIKYFNGVILPPVAGFCVLFGTYALYKEYKMNKKKKEKMYAVP